MSKSHYFVQKPPEKSPGKVRYCAYCGMPFETNYPTKKYCTRDCYHKAIKGVKHDWYIKNHERIQNRREKERREQGMLPYEEFVKHQRGFKLRDRVIKRDLILLELMNFQVKPGGCKINYRPSRKKFSPAKVALIKEKLETLELYEEQILEERRYTIDYSRDFKGRKLFDTKPKNGKMPKNGTKPKNVLKPAESESED